MSRAYCAASAATEKERCQCKGGFTNLQHYVTSMVENESSSHHCSAQYHSWKKYIQLKWVPCNLKAPRIKTKRKDHLLTDQFAAFHRIEVINLSWQFLEKILQNDQAERIQSRWHEAVRKKSLVTRRWKKIVLSDKGKLIGNAVWLAHAFTIRQSSDSKHDF